MPAPPYAPRLDAIEEQELEPLGASAKDPPERNSLDAKQSRWRPRARGCTAPALVHRLVYGPYARLTRRLVLALVALPCFTWILLCLFAHHPALFPPTLFHARSTLLVVAHPDDECLFFSPSLLSMARRSHGDPAVLVLSVGNAYGLGHTRRRELKESCRELGVPSERCDVLDLPHVQDDPTTWWPVEDIIAAVRHHVANWNVDAIITFDHGGVSGHINHRAVSAALTQYILSPPPAPAAPLPSLYLSESVPLLRKYSGLFDLPLSALPFAPYLFVFPFASAAAAVPDPGPVAPLEPPYDATTEAQARDSERRRVERARRGDEGGVGGETGLLVSGWGMYLAGRRAFWRHDSQVSWDRHLYLLVSRYMYINTISRVV